MFAFPGGVPRKRGPQERAIFNQKNESTRYLSDQVSGIWYLVSGMNNSLREIGMGKEEWGQVEGDPRRRNIDNVFILT